MRSLQRRLATCALVAWAAIACTSDPVREPPRPDSDQPTAEPSLESSVEGAARWTLEPKPEGWRLAALVDDVSSGSGVRIGTDARDPRIRRARFGFVGPESVATDDLLRWFRSVLHTRGLSLVPADGDGARWRIVAADAWGRDGTAPRRVAPADLPALAEHDGLFLRTRFVLEPRVDAADVVQGLTALSSHAGAHARLELSPSGRNIDAADYAPNLALIGRVLAELGVLADPPTAEFDDARLRADPDDTLVTLPSKQGGYSVLELLAWASGHGGFVFHYEATNDAIRFGRFESIGESDMTRSRILGWLRAVLRANDLALVPLGAAGPSGVRRWYVAADADPVSRSRPVFVSETEVEHVSAYDSTYVATVLHLHPRVDPEELRHALRMLRTRAEGVASIRVVPGMHALVVKDFARQVATMRSVLREMDALEDRSGSFGSAPAPAREAGTVIPPSDSDAETVRGLLAWANRELGMTFVFPTGFPADSGFDRVRPLGAARGGPPIRRAGALSWLQSALGYQGQALVPVLGDGSGTGPQPRAAFRQCLVLDAAHPLVSSHPLVVPFSDAQALERHLGSYVVTGVRISAGVDVEQARSAVSPRLAKSAALGRATALPSERTILLRDTVSSVRAARRLLDLAGFLEGVRVPESGSDFAGFLDRPLPARSAIEARSGTWSLPALFGAAAAASGDTFLWSGPHPAVNRVQVAFTPPLFPGSADDVVRAVLGVLFEHRLGAVPLAPAGPDGVGACWGIIHLANPRLASGALVASQAELAALPDSPGLFLATVFQLADDADAARMHADIATLSTPTAGLGWVRAVRGSQILVAYDFAPALQAMLRRLESRGALR